MAACRELGRPASLLVGPAGDRGARSCARAGGAGLRHRGRRRARTRSAWREKVTRATLKKRSSIHVAVELVRDGAADAFFSAGNTAACWTIAKLTLGTLEEVDRPGAGRGRAAPDGPHRAPRRGRQRELQGPPPRGVRGDGQGLHERASSTSPTRASGLMSMGEEETKGNELTKEVHEVLKDSTPQLHRQRRGARPLHGQGGRHRHGRLHRQRGPEGQRDPGRVADAPHQGGARCARRCASWARCSRAGAFRAVKQRIDPAEYGGAPLLGVKGCCVIGHGRSNAARHQARHPRRRRVLHAAASTSGSRPSCAPWARARSRHGGGALMSLAFVFPGQGSQKVGHGPGAGRGRSRRAAPSSTRPTPRSASPLSRLCFEGPEDDLQLTANTQPAILATSIAALRARCDARGVAPGLRGRAQPGRVLGAGGRGRARPRATRWSRCAGAASTCRRRCRWARAPWPPSSASTCRRSRPACREAAQGAGGGAGQHQLARARS